MFKKLAAAAAVSMVLAAPAMADSGFETSTTGWSVDPSNTTITRQAYNTDVSVDVAGTMTPVTVVPSTDTSVGSYFGLLEGGSSWGVQTSYSFGWNGTSAAGDKLWLSILSADNISSNYDSNGVYFGDTVTIEYFDGNGSTVINKIGTTGLDATISGNWYSFVVPTSTNWIKVTLGQGDQYNVAKLAIDYTNAAAVPEPETYALMIAGLGAVGFMARRRKAA